MTAPWRKPTFFAALYFLQGAAFAYVVNFQKPYLAGKGVSKESLGLFTSLLLLPFIFKVFLGMLSDRVAIGRFGSRKPYMLVGLLLFAACYLVLAKISHPAQNFLFFASVTWIASLGLALFDTCCDGWAVDVSSEAEQGTIQAAMVAGRALGLISASMAFGWLSQRYSYQLIFAVLALVAGAVAIVVAMTGFNNSKALAAVKADSGFNWRNLLTPAYAAFAIYGIFYSISSFGVDGVVTLFLSEVRQVEPGKIGVFGAFRGVGALIGAVLASRLLKRTDLGPAATYSLVLVGVGCVLPMLLGVVPGGLLWGICWGMQETVYMSLAMHFSRGAWAATFFAIAMIFSNVGTAIGEGVAAPLAGLVGYKIMFLIFGGGCLLLAVFSHFALKIKKPA